MGINMMGGSGLGSSDCGYGSMPGLLWRRSLIFG